MTNHSDFKIILRKIETEIYSENPVDLLDELSNFQRGTREFCYLNNQEVIFSIGSVRIRVFLEPDICLILEQIPLKISDLAQGKPMEICFTESVCYVVKFMPVSEKITCIVQQFGYSCINQKFELDKSQVLAEFEKFLDNIMNLAINQGYIKAYEKQTFLSPMSYLITYPTT